IIQTALRELSEEAGIILQENQVEKVGILHFFYAANPNRNQDVHIFSGIYNGNFKETEEMNPQWRDIESIPYNHMREDDSIWLPKLIKKQTPFDMTFMFNEEGKLAEYF
ncbi:MAG TPA: NUDIX domain-containing protein, partial [Candidatus Absconditabacterales bacterium]|nr:NUDIX domain-containing protein [Candidatus Absconditabacterales bacterium]